MFFLGELIDNVIIPKQLHGDNFAPVIRANLFPIFLYKQKHFTSEKFHTSIHSNFVHCKSND